MKSAFTLIEMIVVLTILAVLTHLAVREAGALRDGRLRAAANRQLEEIRGAVEDFAADMGRLPRSLKELWELPSGATRARVVDACTVDRTLPTNRVVMVSGWRGPYLRLPIGKGGLYDPWGNDYVQTVTNGELVAVGCLGANGSSADDDIALRFDGGGGDARISDCSLTVTLDFTGREEQPTSVTSKLFSPTGSGLAIRTNLSSKVMTFSGLTRGAKTLWESVTDSAHAVEVTKEASSKTLTFK